MKRFLILLVCAFFLSACGNNSGDSRSGGGSAQTTSTQSGIEATIAKTVSPIGEEVSVAFTITPVDGKDIRGVIDFGDGTRERFAGNGTATHLYPNAGVYSIVIQIDGEEGVEIGRVTIDRGVSPNCPPDVEVVTANCSIGV